MLSSARRLMISTCGRSKPVFVDVDITRPWDDMAPAAGIIAAKARPAVRVEKYLDMEKRGKKTTCSAYRFRLRSSTLRLLPLDDVFDAARNGPTFERRPGALCFKRRCHQNRCAIRIDDDKSSCRIFFHFRQIQIKNTVRIIMTNPHDIRCRQFRGCGLGARRMRPFSGSHC